MPTLATLLAFNGSVLTFEGGALANSELTPTSAPVISLPDSEATGSTTANGSFTTDTGSGTGYGYVSTSATPPSFADLVSGTGAAAHIAQAVSGTGVQDFSFTGLTAETEYYVHFGQRTSGGDSNVVSSTSFTTEAAAAGEAEVIFPPAYEQDETATGIVFKIDGSTVHTQVATGVIGTAINYTGSGPFNTELALEILALNGSGESSLTYGEIAYFTAPESPVVLAAEVLSSTAIRLTATVPDAPINGGHSVYRKTGEDVFTLLETITAFPYDVTGLLASSEEEFKVETHNDNDTPILPTSAGFSNTVTATTDSVPLGWETKKNVAEYQESVMSTEGELVFALNFGRNDGDRIINGVTFPSVLHFGDFLYDEATSDWYINVGHEPPTTSLDEIMSSIMYGGSSVPLAGLEVGETYRVQALYSDERAGSEAYQETLVCAGHSSSPIYRNPGFSATCVFEATATTEYLTGVDLIQAVQVRKLS